MRINGKLQPSEDQIRDLPRARTEYQRARIKHKGANVRIAGESGEALAAGGGNVHPGADFSDDEVEFIKAMERYRREMRRPWPTCSEVLFVLKGLGYRKAGDVAEPPAGTDVCTPGGGGVATPMDPPADS